MQKIVWNWSFFPPPEMSKHSERQDRRLGRAIRKAPDNIDPTPTIEVTSRDFPGCARVVIQRLNAGSDSDGSDGSGSGSNGESDSDGI